MSKSKKVVVIETAEQSRKRQEMERQEKMTEARINAAVQDRLDWKRKISKLNLKFGFEQWQRVSQKQKLIVASVLLLLLVAIGGVVWWGHKQHQAEVAKQQLEQRRQQAKDRIGAIIKNQPADDQTKSCEKIAQSEKEACSALAKQQLIYKTLEQEKQYIDAELKKHATLWQLEELKIALPSGDKEKDIKILTEVAAQAKDVKADDYYFYYQLAEFFVNLDHKKMLEYLKLSKELYIEAIKQPDFNDYDYYDYDRRIELLEKELGS